MYMGHTFIYSSAPIMLILLSFLLCLSHQTVDIAGFFLKRPPLLDEAVYRAAYSQKLTLER